ncbi:MAG: hypothetical protein II816_04590 [Elusimicrobia bacterium]|nr:hypothetical protein [Elusimicrobiota bacterium]
MKHLILVFAVCSLFFVCGVKNVSAEGLTVTQKIENAWDSFLQIKYVSKTIDTIKSWWESFKVWFNNLPGIRHYNNSVYSSKNWKAAMNDMGGEYKQHLRSDSAGANMLREGKKEWDKL